jgi:diguanylate cyclase (GGDEF)-like protein
MGKPAAGRLFPVCRAWGEAHTRLDPDQLPEMLGGVNHPPVMTNPIPALHDDLIVYLSEHTRVVRRLRARALGGDIVLKQAIGTEAIKRLQHERAMLARVAGLPGVPRLAPGMWDVDTLALVDDHGTSLATRLAAGPPLPPDAAVAIAISLAQTLAGVHGRGMVHKDVAPANVLLTGDAHVTTVLIDFNVASSTAEQRPDFTHQRQIAGTLAYMAPEQTGRSARPVDPRSDLYALGATLYEMLCGRTPFESSDLLDLVHDHLTRTPLAPVRVDATLPLQLSEIVMRLLQKDPDQRYQSASGLLHDLRRVRQALADGATPAFALGERDFAQHIAAPDRPIGRDHELARLKHAVQQLALGQTGMLLVSGAPGVGKTTLLNELRPLVTACGGWFVSGKFDQYLHDAPSAVVQALRSLGRILLAQPPAELAAHRQRVLASLGVNAGLGVTRLPEFALLLGELPEVSVSDPVQAQARVIQSAVDLLRGIASAGHPVVMRLDDLQWAPAASLNFLDALLAATPPVQSLLLVGAYRAADVDASHPLTAMLARWRLLGVAPEQIHLSNLSPPHLGTLVAEMLRMPAAEGAALSQALGQRTDGNPYDTVELINGLRQDGLLSADEGGWRWDRGALHRYVGGASVVDLLTRRLHRLPAATRHLLEVVACLGGTVGMSVLEVATGLAPSELDPAVAPAVLDGLLTVEAGDDSLVGFRHDRVQQAVFEQLDGARRHALHLELARRFAAVPGFGILSAEQYLPAVPLLADANERRRVAVLFGAAAGLIRNGNFAAAERFLCAAIGLLEHVGDARDLTELTRLRIDHHAALYALGRLDEADALYAVIDASQGDAMRLIDALRVQVYSLINRGRQSEAFALGLQALAQLGLHRPDDLRSALGEGMARLSAWQAGTDKLVDLTRPETTDAHVLARAELIGTTATAAYFCDPAAFAWLALEAHRSWVDDGPCISLMAIVGTTPYLLVGAPQDYRGAYAVGRHLLNVGDARGLEPGTSCARFVFAVSSLHWVEPVENAAGHFQHAREGLMQASDLQFAAYTYLASDALLDTAPTLEASAMEVDASLAFAARSGNDDVGLRALPRRQLLRALRGETLAAGSFDDADFDEGAHAAAVAAPSIASSAYHLFRALCAALFDDGPGLLRHATAAMPLLARSPGYYITAIGRVLHALALARHAADCVGDEQAAALEGFDIQRQWLAARAADAPHNFGHLLTLLDAERAWAIDDIWLAGATFHTAMAQAAQRARPWHRALITERAGLFHLALGMETRARPLLDAARALYEAWGAAGKVRQMVADHAFLRTGSVLREGRLRSTSATISDHAVDVTAVLRASQVLSSQTSLQAITTELSNVLGGMAGATSVDLLVRTEDDKNWYVAGKPDASGERVGLTQAAAAGLLPLSPVRYVERTGERLVLEDALRDERFAGDPCWVGMDQCSLLVLPIHKRGAPHALLVLQNRLQRAAFFEDRLDAVVLIAGQLSASLDNALLYASLERKVAERTLALEDANTRLASLSETDALTGLANRRRFDQALESESISARRSGLPLGVVMFDVDEFKSYNDHHGHQGGDTCLQHVAAALKSSLRGGRDLLARYGGEEFVVLLPDTDLAGAMAVAERMRAAVEARQQAHPAAALGIVTISAGVASCAPADLASAVRTLKAADAALYEAKKSGRNRVCAAAVAGGT